MTELKTLNKVSFQNLAEENKDGEPSIELWGALELIKQEAIKWVKELEKGNSNWEYVPKDIEEFVESHGDDCSPTTNKLMYWIKHFFNITEEDLK